MKKGVIENEPQNWRILGRYYQEANMNTQAIAVLQEATAKFPKNGELEVQIAQIYLQLENTREAFNHARSAVTKGNFEGSKPFSVNYLVAYTAYELGEVDAAMAAINACEKFEESKKDGQFPRLREVIKEAIAEREAKNKPKAEAAPKKTASNR
jgi:tetratricopeptide (TPR) repeat protein